MTLIEKLIKDEEDRKKRNRALVLIIIVCLIIIFSLKDCQNENNTSNSLGQKVELNKTSKLDFKDIKSTQFTEEKLSLKAYKLLIISSLKSEIDSKVNFDQCNIESEIDWIFRWYPKSGEIKNSTFKSFGSQINKRLEDCLKDQTYNLRIDIENDLELAYISLDLKIK